MAGPVSYGRRLSEVAEERPDHIAITYVPETGEETYISYRELDIASNRAARVLTDRGVVPDSTVAVALGNSPSQMVASFGAWKLGACVLSLRSALTPIERDRILEVASPIAVVADWDLSTANVISGHALNGSGQSHSPVSDRIPRRSHAIASGGSTGRPKIVVATTPAEANPGDYVSHLLNLEHPNQVHLVTTPLYHTTGFIMMAMGIFEGVTLVLMERFDAERAVDLIERHQVSFTIFVPTQLQRLLQLPGIEQRDFSSIETILHGGGPCPAWVKRAWINLIGPERIIEGIGTTEGTGIVKVRGDEWLKRPGTVGRPETCEVRILDRSGKTLPVGDVGEIFMRQKGSTEIPFTYLGEDPVKSTEDGFASVGDLGWLDNDGYLFIADRRVDLIITGGANVSPAEVESALSEHPQVSDSAVLGVPDSEWGQRVHAVIHAINPSKPPSVKSLDTHCRERLSSYKVPKSYEFVTEFPRDAETGKLARPALLAARQTWTPGMLPSRHKEGTRGKT